MSMKLWGAFIGTVELKHGILADGDGEGVDGLLTDVLADGDGEGVYGLLTAWDATSGRIPILWSKAVAEDGIDDDGYNTFLRWYGKRQDGIDDDDYKTFVRWYRERLHKEPMWVERSREMAKMLKDDGNSSMIYVVW
eukprot:CAMPEP_0185791350 /NCGR_PEP_ID=MMETSP1174-20130828/158328_1 /TAXON_ID=35687 /ORGANISM="Dictyocha speculum, Strain CCMP1381" /LENGTH=136 /DNA_ID=CAMNT_0028486295 /DNA_START=797 /DNA_END=1205 /DNA_ORIENTATION=+